MTTYAGADRSPDVYWDANTLTPHPGADREWIVTSVTDITPPVISNVSPAPGSNITQTTTISFDATDNVGFRRLMVLAEYPDGSYEVVHDGDAFSQMFSSQSTMVIIPNGYHYSLGRTIYWPGSPIIRIFAIDASGNEA